MWPGAEVSCLAACIIPRAHLEIGEGLEGSSCLPWDYCAPPSLRLDCKQWLLWEPAMALTVLSFGPHQLKGGWQQGPPPCLWGLST